MRFRSQLSSYTNVVADQSGAAPARLHTTQDAVVAGDAASQPVAARRNSIASSLDVEPTTRMRRSAVDRIVSAGERASGTRKQRVHISRRISARTAGRRTR